LPFGFYGGVGFGSYGKHPSKVVHQDGSETPLQPASHVTVLCGILIALVAFWYLAHLLVSRA
jgi:hypothetical protein